MIPINRLLELHEWMRRQRVLDTFNLLTRWLLALAFIRPGLIKVLGEPFTRISPETPIGAFFEAFFQAGPYYFFVGLGQVVAGLLLLNRRTSLFGAILYFPIILNIVVITWAMDFTGTWLVTFFMLAANGFLLFWHFDRLQGLLVTGTIRIRSEQEWLALRSPAPARRLLQVGASAVALGLICLALLIAGMRGFLPSITVVAFGCIGMSLLPLAAAAAWELLRSRFRPA